MKGRHEAPREAAERDIGVKFTTEELPRNHSELPRSTCMRVARRHGIALAGERYKWPLQRRSLAARRRPAPARRINNVMMCDLLQVQPEPRYYKHALRCILYSVMHM